MIKITLSHTPKEMHVGEEYQANVPPAPLPMSTRMDSHLDHEAQLLWQPNHLSEEDLMRYQQDYSRTLTLVAPTTRVPDDEEVGLFKIIHVSRK